MESSEGKPAEATPGQHAERYIDSATQRKSEGHLVAAIRVAGFFLYQEEGTERTAREMTFLDNGMRNLLGIPEDQDHRARDYWIEHIHPDDLRNVMSVAIARFENAGEDTVSAEYRYLNEQRGTLWFSHAAHALHRNEHGHVLRLVGAVLDITERKRVEDERNAAHDRLQHILDNLQDCYFQADLAGRLTLVSPSAVLQYGYASAAEMIGLCAADLYGSASARAAVVREVQEKGHVTDWVGQGRRKNGSTFWVSGSIQLLRDNEGRVIGTEGMIRDITERKQAERARQESENRYRSLFENASNGIFHSTPQGGFIRANPALARMLGYDTPANLIAAITDIESQLYIDFPTHSELAAKGSNDGWAYVERRYRRKDGGIMVGRLALRQVPNADGSTDYLEGFVDDITDRKRIEESLRESEGRFRTLFEDAPIAICISRNGTSLHANRAYFRLFALADSCDIGSMQVAEFWSSESRGGIENLALRSIQHPAAPAEYDGIAKRSDGSHFPAHVMATMANLPDGPATIGFVTDLTDRHRALQEREQLQASLAQADRLASMGMLAAGVAHEINNPLAYVLYNIQGLSEELPLHARQLEQLAESFRQRFGATAWPEILGDARVSLEPTTWADMLSCLADAVSGAQKIKEIVRGLGTFSRVDDQVIVPVHLTGAIESALCIAANEIKYRARVERDLPQTARVMGNEGKLSQVFLNLLINAAHSIRGGDVEKNVIGVRAWQRGATVCVEVRDTGCGIAPEHIDRIFDPFFTTKPVGVGSGLGLSIVRNIVTGFGGRISVESKVGSGTSFLVEFPATSEQLLSRDPPTAICKHATIRGRVLVVDDEARIRTILTRICRGHDVVEAESGEHARRLLATDRRFDVILCDMMMPDVTGMDLHRWLVDQDPQLAKRVVFVTGGAFTPEEKAYLDGVENLTIDKPFDIDVMRRILAESIEFGKAIESN